MAPKSTYAQLIADAHRAYHADPRTAGAREPDAFTEAVLTALLAYQFAPILPERLRPGQAPERVASVR